METWKGVRGVSPTVAGGVCVFVGGGPSRLEILGRPGGEFLEPWLGKDAGIEDWSHRL